MLFWFVIIVVYMTSEAHQPSQGMLQNDMSDDECLRLMAQLEEDQSRLLVEHRAVQERERIGLSELRKRFYSEGGPIVEAGLHSFHYAHIVPVIRQTLEAGELLDGFPQGQGPQDAQIRDMLAKLEDLPAEDIHESYVSLHSPEYNGRLQALTESLPSGKLEIFKSCKYAICICVRNEVMMRQTIEALAQSYGNEFSQDVGVLLYQNYTDRSLVSEAEITELQSIAQLDNVVVVEEQVAPDVRLAEVKKVASDILLNLLPADTDTTIIFTDADLVGLSASAIQQSEVGYRKRQREGIPFAAATTGAYPDRRLKDRFPVLALEQMLNHYVNDHLIRHDIRNPKTIGSWIVASKRAFEACGGFIPEEMHEDMQLTTQLNLASGCYASGKHAVIDMGIEGTGLVRAFYNPNREIEAILRGIEDSRFLSANYLQSMGAKRLDWMNLSFEEPPHRLLKGQCEDADVDYVVKRYIVRNIPRFDIASWVNDQVRIRLLRAIQMAVLEYGASFNVQSIACKYVDTSTHQVATATVDLNVLENNPSWVIIDVDVLP